MIDIAKTKSIGKTKDQKRPRILIVTPEITYLPSGMGNMAQRMSAKAGGMADVSSSLINALFELGADVHVALPNYSKMFHSEGKDIIQRAKDKIADTLGEQRIHLAEDPIFYRKDQVYDPNHNHLAALAFQREVINNIIPKVQPNLIHCNDWMTGLIPAVSKRLGIPSLFTLHNIHSERLSMGEVEDRGIDASEYWRNLYFTGSPENYEDARHNKKIDFLATGIFAADHVNTVSKTFLYEVVEGKHTFVPKAIQSELANKLYAGHATGILNAPDATFDPQTDIHIKHHFDETSHIAGKAANKKQFQEEAGLKVDPYAPLFFWPSRLDPMQKGCQLLADILYQLTSDYADTGLQVGIVASGEYEQHFHDIVNLHGLHDRVAVKPFNEGLSRLAYAGSDFIIMPSKFEPCGLPQMAAPMYGTLPVVHNTGGIHDTVDHLHYDGNLGNGFRFDDYGAEGLRWAIDEAVKFHRWDSKDKARVIQRIMKESKLRFNHKTTATAYIDLYSKMLGHPVVNASI